jgi:hypothetical protein
MIALAQGWQLAGVRFHGISSVSASPPKHAPWD